MARHVRHVFGVLWNIRRGNGILQSALFKQKRQAAVKIGGNHANRKVFQRFHFPQMQTQHLRNAALGRLYRRTSDGNKGNPLQHLKKRIDSTPQQLPRPCGVLQEKRIQNGGWQKSVSLLPVGAVKSPQLFISDSGVGQRA